MRWTSRSFRVSVAAMALGTVACVHQHPPAAQAICRGTPVLVVENGTAQNLEVVWGGRTLGVAFARATSRLPAPSDFPCHSSGDCPGPEFRTQGGGLPEPGPFRQSFSYFIECH